MKKTLLMIMLVCLSLALGAQTVFTIGTGTSSNGTTGAPTPYGTWYKAFRQQYLYTASELSLQGAAAGAITRLDFQVANLNNCSPMPNYRIRLKHTTQNSLSSSFEGGTYTQVFHSASFMPVSGWNSHVFSEDFMWDGVSNILVDIVTDVIAGSYSQNASVYYSATGFNSSLRYQSDSSNGTVGTTGTASSNRSNTRLYIQTQPITEVPGAAVLPAPATGATDISTMQELSWQVGTGITQGFRLSLGTNNPPTNLVNNQDLAYTLSYQHPSALQSNSTYYWQIVPYNSLGTASDCPIWSFSTANETTVIIGTDTNSSSFPFYSYYEDARTQMLFSADELSAVGIFPGQMLQQIAFDVVFANSAVLNDLMIRIKNTDLQSLSGFDTDTTDFQTCYLASQALSGSGWNSFQFSEPFLYLGNSGILIDVSFNNDGWSANSTVNASAASGKTWARYMDGGNGAHLTGGSAQANRPNIRFTFAGNSGGDPAFYVNYSAYDFGEVNIGGSRIKEFKVFNAGGGELSVQELQISGSAAFQLQDLPTLPALLETGQYASFTVRYSPVMVGADVATISIRDDTEARATHSISLSGTGTNDITIGDGAQNARVPLDFYYKSSLYETIFTQGELNNFIGFITGIKLYNSFSSSIIETPVKIWLGSTLESDLSADWIPANQLSLVYDGFVDFPTGQNTINIEFPEPYLFIDGGNLAMMIQRPLDSGYYSSSDSFKCSTGASNRARNAYSDSADYDPNAPGAGSVTGIYPKITFSVIPGGVGHILGRISGVDGNPISQVKVLINASNSAIYSDQNGEFIFPNLLPGSYELTLSKHGYISQQHTIDVAEDQTVELELILHLMPQVAVSGVLIASDTLAGIFGANLTLTGYQNYETQSLADGSFLFPAVFAGHSYQYRITHAGYSGTAGTIDVGAADYQFGQILLNELAFAPYALVASLSANQATVELSWQSPDPNATGFSESFESTQFPPQNWSQSIHHTGEMMANGAYPTWHRNSEILSGSTIITPTDGSYQAGLWWAYEPQDEWLITQDFSCPSDAIISFDTRVYCGSEHGDHYYVKLSPDGGQNWQILWDASAESEAANNYEIPVYIDISAFSGRQIRLAFHAQSADDDGLWHEWYIDNLRVASALRSATRGLEGYDLWRFHASQLTQAESWVQINSEVITGNTFTDADFASLPQGDYYWALKARYTNMVASSAAISNMISKQGGIPAAPQNFKIQVLGDDILLSWDPVTTDNGGNPIQISLYEIHILSSPAEEPSPFTILDYCSDTSYLIPEVTPWVDRLFFVVKAKGAD